MTNVPLQARFSGWAEAIGAYSLRAVGIDLSGSDRRPTGWAALRGPGAECATLRTDDEIVAATVAARPRVVSIDSPLSVPETGIIRESERELMALGVGVYPCLLPSMRALTARGMRLRERLEAEGLRVIEGFPGAAQDALGIPRKKASVAALRAGLEAYGLTLPAGRLSHHELDAVTAALIGQFHARGRSYAFGAEGEAPIVTPLTGAGRMRLVCGDAAALRYAANYLALFHGVRLGGRGRAIELPACRTQRALREWLYGAVTNAATSAVSPASDGR
jgi:predicted nuclease with RNAse H fold